MEELERAGWGKLLQFDQTIVIEPATKKTVQAAWALAYEEEMRNPRDPLQKGSFRFSLIDVDRDGTPELFFKSDKFGSVVCTNMHPYSGLSFTDEEVYYSGNDIWTIESSLLRRPDLQTWITIEKTTLVNSSIVSNDSWVEESGQFYTYMNMDHTKDKEITADEYQAAKRQAQSGTRVRFEHTYNGGDINLEEYWP